MHADRRGLIVSNVSRGSILAGAAGIAAASIGGGFVRRARAATKVRFLTNWFAEAEHGGFYQAKATGLYDKAGLDVDIQMGGPQVNGMQLLAGGDADIILSYDIETLNSVEHGLPVVAIGAVNQFDLQGIMAHANVSSLASLKGHRILVSSTAFTTYWPWLKLKFGFTDDMTAPYTFNLQPFFIDPNVAQQAYITAEPFDAQQHHVPVKFFLFADEGYPPYSSTLVTTRPYIQGNSDVVARFVRATMEGWKSYLQSPAPGNALIVAANPKMEADQIAASIAKFKQIKCVTGGDAATMGIGVMTDARWKKTRDFMVAANMLKASTDWKQAYTLAYVRDLKVMP
jgi:NitT/TauT family transport system substrate-binding protein